MTKSQPDKASAVKKGVRHHYDRAVIATTGNVDGRDIPLAHFNYSGYTIEMDGTMNLKLADNKGRVLLGKSYAGATLLAEHHVDGTITLRPAVTVPTNEVWLWKNKKALDMVMQGLGEARRGKHARGPDLKAAARLAAKIKD